MRNNMIRMQLPSDAKYIHEGIYVIKYYVRTNAETSSSSWNRTLPFWFDFMCRWRSDISSVSTDSSSFFGMLTLRMGLLELLAAVRPSA